MTGTDLEIIPSFRPVIAGADAERLPSLHTNANTDHELLAVWLRSHADGSPHTRRAYERIGRRFLAALAATGADLKRYTIDDVHAALEAMRTRADGTPASGASVNTNVAAVKALLGFAHKVGFSRFNAAPLTRRDPQLGADEAPARQVSRSSRRTRATRPSWRSGRA